MTGAPRPALPPPNCLVHLLLTSAYSPSASQKMYVPLLVDDFLLRPAKLFPQKIAIVDNERQYTYADYQRRVNQLSHALIAMGVKKGERVCILSPNSHFFLESFYATSQIGAILVPLNYRMVPDDHEYIINHAGVTTLLVDYEYTEMINGIRPQLAKVRNWVVAAHDDVERPGWSDWEALIAPQSGELPAAVERDENDIVSINYTSGTTARPKGVMLTHRNLYLNAYSLISHLQVCHDDVELWTLAMFHTNGWGTVYALTGQGGTHVVMRAVEGRQIYELIEKNGVTLACMAPAVLRIVLDYPDKIQHNITTRPRFIVAGAAPPATFIERLEKELGWRFIQIYGLTETAPFLTSSQPDFGTSEDDYARRARAGTPGIGVEIKLIDDAGHEVPKDGTSIGEVCARSSVVFEGYWEQQEETEKAIYDGYFHTGDLAFGTSSSTFT